MNFLKASVTAIAMSVAVVSEGADIFLNAEEVQTANATFRSEAPEQWYGGFGTREFIFADGQWELIFTHALDPAMTMRTFVFRTGGAYHIVGPSEIVDGAMNGTFQEEWKHVTLLTEIPEVIAGMGMADCGLIPNLETDISESGCAAWRPVSVCGEDHDLIAMTEVGVQFGIRPQDNDMCTEDKRPTALLPIVALFQYNLSTKRAIR